LGKLAQLLTTLTVKCSAEKIYYNFINKTLMIRDLIFDEEFTGNAKSFKKDFTWDITSFDITCG
jgi:hypothetical protein